METTKVFSKTFKAIREGFTLIVNVGGTRSGKSYAILQLLFFIAYKSKKPRIITCVSQTYEHLRTGLIRDFDHILQSENVNPDDVRVKNPYVYTIGNSIIEFVSLDKPGKALGGQRDILFGNEINQLIHSTFHQLMQRTSWFTLADYNPASKFWIDINGYLNEKTTKVIHSTYLDNINNLSKNQIDTIEKGKRKAEEEDAENKRSYWWHWWQCYGLGRLSIMVDRLIFPKAERGDIIPDTANFLSYGVDFSNSENQNSDPHAIVGLHYANHCLYIEAIYEGICPVDKVEDGRIVFSETEPTDLSSICLYQCPGVSNTGERLFVTDRANDGDRKLLERHGVNTMPSLGKLVSEGINALNRYDKIIIIDKFGWLWDEFQNYLWDTDKDGVIIAGKPAPRQADHGIKAAMYGLEPWDR